MKSLVIIPTYNEKENIEMIVSAVLQANPQVEILVVDDNSPDGTGEVVEKMRRTEKRLHHLHRQGKEGLGKAYIAGFQWGLQRPMFDAICEMDADFSHRPVDLSVLLREIEHHDFVVGS